MRAQEFITEKYLYHATFTKNVPSIVKNGLRQFEPSNWAKASSGGGTGRYNDEAGIFAFDHPEDATSWAQKMEWDFRSDQGTGRSAEENYAGISIIRINPSDLWGNDPSLDPGLQFGKGKAMRSQSNINPADVIDVFALSDFGNAMTHNMSRDEWLEMVSKKLEA